jgi:hypothetical protein
MGYKNLCLGCYLCPNHLANPLQFSAYNLIENPQPSAVALLNLIEQARKPKSPHRHRLLRPLHPVSTKKPQGPAGRLKVIDPV